MTSTTAPDRQIVPAQPVGIRGSLARFGRAPVLVIAAAVAILVWLGRGMTFYHDEYALLLLRDLSFDGILAPHNEHLSATLVLLYRGLIGTVGTASYWPYLAVTYALHVIVATIVYVVVRRETSAIWALGAMAVMLLLGSGGDDILWAFQSGTIGAMAAGMAAVVLAPRRPAIAAVLLTLGLFTSGSSLAFLVATGVHLLLVRPRALAWLALPVGLYLAWYVGYGAGHILAMRSPSLDGVPAYVAWGLAASAAGIMGSAEPAVGVVVLVALTIGLAWARTVSPLVVAMLVSSVAFFAIAGLVRAQLGPEQATASRYVYVAAPGLLIAAAVPLARLPLPWRNIVGATLLTVALLGNTVLLVAHHDRFLSMIQCERALTPVARGSAGNPC
ncbi:MAG: hypothetical protein ABJC39_07195 [Chloroflexota bacterium]